ncbi:MAG: glycosyltransferase [Rhizobiaceae bacterium]|nr:glycosyltransferase [Rhizobiaceae bacterium]MCV0406930.1 glycosyltransferase [Rhizobiaceae bacterium]
MRISIHTLGTRGDVQPYLALARRLAARGHDVRLAAPEQFAQWIASRGVAVDPLPGEFLALIDSREGKQAIAGSDGFTAGLKLLPKVRPLMSGLLDAEAEAMRAFAPDMVIHHPKTLAAPHLAEAMGIPRILASPLPGFTPTVEFPSPLLPFRSLGPFNRASHGLAIHATNLLFGRTIRAFRAALGLPVRDTPPLAGTIYAYSEHVLPKPDDWGDDVLVSGYWFLDEGEDYTPPADLEAFLAAGDPPVYVGFGSMPGLDPVEIRDVFLAGIALADRRAILSTGGGALAGGRSTDDVFFLDAAPHDWLFPRVGAVIHHGGAGTTAAALRAGRPNAICPFFGDQPFWARRVEDLGVGPPPLDRRKLTGERIAGAIRVMEGAGMLARATDLGERIRGEQGVARAVAFIEDIAASPARNSRRR